MLRPASLAVIVLIGTSCNVAKLHERAGEKRLERLGHTSRVFQAADGPHHVWARDTGREKVLLLHGYSGSGKAQWSRTAKLLGDRYDAIMPDLLCHGLSTTAWNTSGDPMPGTSMDAQVAHVLLLLDSMGITGPIAVVGSSYGGGVAALLAERHPERVKKLVIYDGLVSDYSRAMADSLARSVGASGMMAIMSTPSHKDLRIALRLSLHRRPPVPGFILKQVYEVNVRPYRAAQITLVQDLLAHEERFATRGYQWTMPVHLIWGEHDRLIPVSVGRAIMERNGIPGTNWTVIPRTGHVANIERPRAFDRALRGILAQ